MALLLANRNSVYEDLAIKFFEHFALIAAAVENLWDEQDGFFYDRLRTKDGSSITVRARSIVGLLPVFAAVELDASLWRRLPMFRKWTLWYLEHKLRTKNHLYYLPSSGRPGLISLVEKARFQPILARMLDESESLSPYGLRSLSRYHQEHPVVLDFDGRSCRLDYEPGESHSGLFGGNSNWRGPVRFPLNFLAIESLRHLHNFFGEDLTVELATGSGMRANLDQVATELRHRLLGSPDHRTDACSPVEAEIVEDDDVALFQGWDENLLDIGEETLALDGAVNHARRVDPIAAQRCDEGHGFPVAMGRLGHKPAALGTPAAQRRHVRLDPGLSS
jgi:hypothetical protein